MPYSISDVCFTCLDLISPREFMELHRNMEIMKAGYLSKNISTNTNKKQYKKFYFVLKRDRENSSKKTLEYFKDENSCVKKEPKGVFNLYSQYNVGIKPRQKKKFIFEVVGVSKSHELMTTDETTGNEWVKLLTEGIVMQTFSVIKMSYPPTAQKYVKDMKGTVLLKIDESSVTLLSNNGPAIYWEFSVIRKYKMNNGLLILEVGKKSITGEGEFYFDTPDPKRLYDVLNRAVSESAKKREIIPKTNTRGDYPLMEKRLNFHWIDNKCDTNKTNKTGKVEPNDSTYNHFSHVPDHLEEPSTHTPSSKSTYDPLFSSTRMVTQQSSDTEIAHILNNTKLLTNKTKITSSAINNHDTNKTNKIGNVEPSDATYDHLSYVLDHLATPNTPPPSKKSTYDLLFSSTRMVTKESSDPQIAHILNNTKLLNDKTKITLSAINNHDANKTNKTGNVEPNDSPYDHLSHAAKDLAEPSTPPFGSKNTYDLLFSSTSMATQQKSEPQIAPILNSTKQLCGKSKIASSEVSNHNTNKTIKTEKVEPNDSTYDHLSHVLNHLTKPDTPPRSSENTYDLLFSSTRMVTQESCNPQIANILNNTKLLSHKTKITSSAINNHDANKANKTGKVEPNDSIYDNFSHVSDHFVEPITPPSSSKNTYDLLFSPTNMVRQKKVDPQIANILNNTKLLSHKTKITSSAINNHDANKANKTGKVEPNDSIYDNFSHVSDHFVEPITPPSSSKNTYDLLFSPTNMVRQQKVDPQIAHILNSTKVLSGKSKITLSANNNHDINKTNKTENVEPNVSTYNHLSHVLDHLAKSNTHLPSSKNTYDSLFSSTRMVKQPKFDPQITPFLSNTKLLSCETVASLGIMVPATPVIFENMYVQIDLCQTSEIKNPIPPSSRIRPALLSMGLSLVSEMYLSDKIPFGKFINPTLLPKEDSAGVLNTKNTSTSNSDICDDSNNIYEVLKDPCKLSNNNNKENENSSPNEYHRLFEYPPKQVPNKLPEYNHLKLISRPKHLARTNKIGLQISPVPLLKNKKKPLRPVCPPPLPPPLQKQQPIYEIPRAKCTN